MTEEEFQRIQQLRFEHAVEGMLDQDVRCDDNEGRCRYIYAELRCAVGHCLTDEGAMAADGGQVSSMVELIPQYSFKPELRLPDHGDGVRKKAWALLSDLQACHDASILDGGFDRMARDMRIYNIMEIAEKYELDPGIIMTWIADD